jgi:hypothetical protein
MYRANTEKADVIRFLNKLKPKMSVFGIIFIDKRPKNLQTLTDLEITPAEREQIIQNLAPEDYYKGPQPEHFFGGDARMWEFGKTIKSREVYIKITLGRENQEAICISFHIAERPITYPFK